MLNKDTVVTIICAILTVITLMITAHSAAPDTRPAFSTEACSDVQAAYVSTHDTELTVREHYDRIHALCK